MRRLITQTMRPACSGQIARSARTRDAAPGIGEASQIDKKVRVVSTIEYLLDS